MTQFMRTTARRRGVLGLAGVAAAAALFGAGALAANAMHDDVSQAASTGKSVLPSDLVPGAVQPVPATGAPVTSVGDSSSGYGGADGSAAATSIARPACQPEVGGILGPSGIDLAGRGFLLSTPGDGFTLVSVNVRSEGMCDANGKPAVGGTLTVDTAWRQDSSNISLNLTQRATSEAIANVIRPGTAGWTAGAYTFQATAWGTAPIGIYDKGAPDAPQPAIVPARVGGPDPKAQEMLEAVVARMAPAGGLQCFYREQHGGWEALNAVGVGDPRTAVPVGLVEQSVDVRTFMAPAVGCAAAGAAPLDRSFSAQFSGPSSARGGSFLAVGANGRAAKDQSYPGNIGPGGGSWTDGKYNFFIKGMVNGEPLSFESIRALAHAMDPAFDEACIVARRDLKESDLAALGLPAPTAPDTYSLTKSSLTKNDVDPSCARRPEGFQASYNFSWTFGGKDGGVVQATINRYGMPQNGARTGVIGPTFLNWSDGKGDSFSVSGATKGGSAIPSKDLLIAVAKSMDPALEVSTLSNNPSRVSGASSAGSGSTTAGNP